MHILKYAGILPGGLARNQGKSQETDGRRGELGSYKQGSDLFLSVYAIYLFIYFCLFRAAPTAYGGSQARGQNRSCSHWPIPQPQQHQILNPLIKARDRTCIFMDTSQIHFP